VSGDTITCSTCGTVLYDPPDIVEEGHAGDPCPTCGSTARTYTVSLQPGQIVKAGDGKSRIHLSSRATGHDISERAARRLDELATGSSVRTVTWHDSNEYGDVLCEVRNEDGIVLGVNVGPDLDDAILNLADYLKPPAG
jgi:hypothetical protein